MRDGVRSTSDGYVPCCIICGYEGKTTTRRWRALLRLGEHRRSDEHKRAVRLLSLGIRGKG